MKLALPFEDALKTTVTLCRNGACQMGSPAQPLVAGGTDIVFTPPGSAGGAVWERPMQNGTLVEVFWNGPPVEGDVFEATVEDEAGQVLAREGGTAHFDPPAADGCPSCPPGAFFGSY